MPTKSTRKSKDKERKKEVTPTFSVNTRSRDKKDSADVALCPSIVSKGSSPTTRDAGKGGQDLTDDLKAFFERCVGN
jgi:hypothetical protein